MFVYIKTSYFTLIQFEDGDSVESQDYWCDHTDDHSISGNDNPDIDSGTISPTNESDSTSSNGEDNSDSDDIFGMTIYLTHF